MSLSINPFDLRPAVTSIIDRIEKVRKHLNGRPMVVLMGEDHYVSSHVLLQYLTLTYLKRQNITNISMGVEIPSNMPKFSLSQKGNNDEEIENILNQDETGEISLSEILGAQNIFGAAPISQQSLLRYCLDKSIATCFADAAVLEQDSDILDLEDSRNKSMIQAHMLQDMPSHNSLEPEGVIFRNLFMFDRIKTHMAEVGAKLTILKVGAAHIWGSGDKFKFKGSLAQLFGAANIPFITVLPFGNSFSIEEVPPEAQKYFWQTIAVDRYERRAFHKRRSSR